MKLLLFGLSVISLFLAHYFKVYRMRQFIEIYEKPNEKNLLQALSFGYIINFLLPFRLGDIFRIWYTGRDMKNGVSFSIATIVIDRVLDIIVVGFLFCIFYFLNVENFLVFSSMFFYLIGSFILILGFAVFYKYNKYIKIIIKKFAEIFNSRIELKILKVSWCIITSFKDMILNINKLKLILSTCFMWCLYLVSYVLFANFMSLIGENIKFIDVFLALFSKNSLDMSTLQLEILSFNNFIMILYLVLPLFILLIISFLFKNNNIKNSNNKNDRYFELLPHVNFNDRLIFLEGYFSALSKDYFKNYIKLNRDISIIQDYSAGSNATTMLVTDGNNLFFRKYSFGKDSKKLYEQINWLKKHNGDISLTEVLNVKYGDNYCSYDMPYVKNSLNCFNYIHSTSLNSGWKIIKMSLNQIDKNLHSKNVEKSDFETMSKYIDTKVVENIKKIKNGYYIKELLKYDYLVINGRRYHNLKFFDKYLSRDYLLKVFSVDEYADIHGDFTIENIICLNGKKKGFYIIDPNTGNVHNSPNLDYAKLLQSLHGGYEFLMKTKSVDVNGNNINYLFTKSLVYDELYIKYKEYLYKKFSKDKVKSIYFHEVVHWLRLIPYKIEKNKERSVLFYAGLIIILNDILEMCGD